MNEEDVKAITACGIFCHVTTTDRAETIASTGLDPAADQSLVLRGPPRPRAIYFAPQAKLEKALALTGDNAKDQKRLVVFKIDASLLAKKQCGPDFGWLSAIVGRAELQAATIALSLRIGGIACYDAVSPAEMTWEEIDNPRYDGSSLA